MRLKIKCDVLKNIIHPYMVWIIFKALLGEIGSFIINLKPSMVVTIQIISLNQDPFDVAQKPLSIILHSVSTKKVTHSKSGRI